MPPVQESGVREPGGNEFTSAESHGARSVRIVQKPADRFGQRAGVSGRDEHTGLSVDEIFADRSDIESNKRDAVRERFRADQSEGFLPPPGQHDSADAAERIVGGRRKTVEHDGFAERFRQAFQEGLVVSGPDDIQHAWRFDLMHGGQQLVDAFAADKLSDRQDVRYAAVRRGRRDRAGQRDRRRDPRDLFLRDALTDQDVPHEPGQNDEVVAGADFPPERSKPAEVCAESVVRRRTPQHRAASAEEFAVCPGAVFPRARVVVGPPGAVIFVVVDENRRPARIPQGADGRGVPDFVQDREVVSSPAVRDRLRNRLRTVECGEEPAGIPRLFREAAVDRETIPLQEQRGVLHVAFDAADDPGVLVDETNTRHRWWTGG